jgi:hypothetical protein
LAENDPKGVIVLVPSKPVVVAKGAFVFCRYSLAVLIWVAFILHIKSLVLLSILLLGLSALLKIKKAPLIYLYEQTLEKLFASGEEVLDEHAMRFAHTLGAGLSLVSALFLYSPFEKVGWIVLLGVAIIKSIGALGLCAASKLYGCINSGGCCRLTRRKVC